MNENIRLEKEGQVYLNFYDFFKKFLKELERYDQNIYQFYFESIFNSDNYINPQFITDLMSRISVPNQNTHEYQLYLTLNNRANELIATLSSLTNQFLNENMMNLFKDLKKEENVTYGIFQYPKNHKCSSCFKDYVESGNDLLDSSPVQLKFCKHTFCRGCLKRYIIKTTNNLIFLTTKDRANNNKRVLNCLNRDCEFILFLDDYYNIFGDELFTYIRKNYFYRLSKLPVNFLLI